MKTVRLVMLFFAVLIVSSCYYYYNEVIGSGDLVERELSYRDFDAIELFLDGQITIQPAADFAVRLKADDNVIDLITVYPSDGGNTLRFGMDTHRSYTQVSIAVVIEMPVLKRLELGNSYSTYYFERPSVTVVTGFTGLETFRLYVNSGEVTIDGLEATLIDVDTYAGTTRAALVCTELDLFSHSGDVTFTGTADTLDLETEYGAEVDLSDLTASVAQVELSRGSHVELTVTDVLRGTAYQETELIYEKSASLDTTGLVIE